MDIYFYIDLAMIVLNIICIVIIKRVNANNIKEDNFSITKKFPESFNLIGLVVFIIVVAMCFLIEYLNSLFIFSVFLPILVVFPIYSYYRFICGLYEDTNKNIYSVMKNNFFLTSLFYL